MHSVMQDLQKAVSRCELINMRDQAYDLSGQLSCWQRQRKTHSSIKLHGAAEEQAAASDRMAVSAHRLNMLVAFFFPLATITTVFGMEIRSGLEKRTAPNLLCRDRHWLADGAFLMFYVRVTNRDN